MAEAGEGGGNVSDGEIKEAANARLHLDPSTLLFNMLFCAPSMKQNFSLLLLLTSSS